MRDETISQLRKFALEMRALLESEINEQLEGIYGFLPNGSFESQTKYPALKKLEEAIKTRNRLEQYIVDEQSTGMIPKDARNKLIRETAFTWINRFVAFKMMETRKLIKETITRGPDSNDFKLWLTEPGNKRAYQKYEAGDFPQNHIGEGPRQEAYRQFLLSRCRTLAEEIRVLFDPDTLQSRLCPRPRVLLKIFECMNKDDLNEAWEAGNDETIGWVYQFFNEEEKNNIYARLYKEKKKIRAEEIPAATELFTPSWIVRWIVENSLGRYWIRMHPKSRLGTTLKYLIPISKDKSLEVKPASKITFLDPACGTMHFGLIAFDLFVKMYEEELEYAGQVGWPDIPSVYSKEEIGTAIIANNLFGIDIDLRAVQLSALTLFLKAKSINSSVKITRSNLACADIPNFDVNQLDNFLMQSGIQDSILGRVVKELCLHLQGIQNAGSLLRIETALEKNLEDEKNKFVKESEQPSLPELATIKFEQEATTEEFWEKIKEKIIHKINEFIESQSSSETTVFFVNEISKGIRFLDVLIRKFDIVCTNPPYMYRHNMNNHLAEFLKNNYPNSKGDLYAAFIERCSDLISSKGVLGMITQQSFMFISSYEKMRKALIEKHKINVMVHLGPHAFDAISGEKVNTTMFVLSKEPDKDARENSTGRYFRLVKEPDGKSKIMRFEEALNKFQNKEEDPIVYHYKQADFDAIPGSPWVYWITLGLRDLFLKSNKLGDKIDWKRGLATGDNFRFIRFWWEVGFNKIAKECNSCDDTVNIGYKWFHYMKSESSTNWHAQSRFVMNWKNDGAEVRKLGVEEGRIASRPQNTEYYFRQGLTYSSVSSNEFVLKKMPKGYIFDQASNSIFPKDISLNLIISVLNSSFAKWVLSLNPTINIVKDDFERIPMPKLEEEVTEIELLVEKMLDLSKREYYSDETMFSFISPNALDDIETKIKEENNFIKKKLDNILFNLYSLAPEDISVVNDGIKSEMFFLDNEQFNSDEETEPSNKISEHECTLNWVSYIFGIVLGRFSLGSDGSLGCGDFTNDTKEMLQKMIDPDGIMVMDEGHSDDITRKIIKCLTIIYGADETSTIIKIAIGKIGNPEQLLRDYLSTKYFKDHIQLYRKRPVYWFLQSPQKKYGVWVFHERFTKDTLFRIQSEYVKPKINLLESQIEDLRAKRDSSEGREQREAEKEISRLTEILDDVREFSKRIKKVTDRGYTPHIDDGVLINMAPLWELIPSWQSELKKAWQSLEKEDWDWSYQAMDHWPDRVKAKCRKNKSFAIAHGLEDIYEGNG